MTSINRFIIRSAPVNGIANLCENVGWRCGVDGATIDDVAEFMSKAVVAAVLVDVC